MTRSFTMVLSFCPALVIIMTVDHENHILQEFGVMYRLRGYREFEAPLLSIFEEVPVECAPENSNTPHRG